MIVKQAVPINFFEGLDTKTDPYQVQMGKFLVLQNSVFTKGGLLQKRNGYGPLAALPNAQSVYLTTLNGNLTALGSSVESYFESNETWVNKGTFQPISLLTLPVGRSAINQVQCDSAVSPSGLVCTVYTENNNGTLDYRYVIADAIRGQVISNPLKIGTGTTDGSPRVFVLGGYFVIVYTAFIAGTSHLQYIAVSISNPNSASAGTLVASYTAAPSLSWDGVVVGNNLYFAYYNTSGGSNVAINYLTSSLILSSPTSFAGSIATHMSVCADITVPSNPVIYAAFYNSGTSIGSVVAVNSSLQPLMTATQIISAPVSVYNITCAGNQQIVSGAPVSVATVFYEVANTYTYDATLPTNFILSVTVDLPATVTTGIVGGGNLIAKSVGLASKAFIVNGDIYVLTEYASALQSTYFLIDENSNIVSRFAYENGGASLSTSAGYLPTGLPQAQVSGSNVYIAYLYKDLIESQSTLGLNPTIGPAGASNIYSQTGINLATIGFNSSTLGASEIGSTLNISGGLLWTFDGQTLNELGFNLFPDNVEATWSTTGGSMDSRPTNWVTGQPSYYVQVIYSWNDAAGNVIRSAPSVPVPITTTDSGSNITTGSITVNIPYLRLTYKQNATIQVYLWSVAEQVYYQVGNAGANPNSAPTLNVTSSDSFAFLITTNEQNVVGNEIIYTTGGVVEDVGGPAAVASTLFDDRLWLIDAEDRNLLWYSKQVIEGTPVEMSDLLTFYVAPSTGAQGSTGPITAIFPMDDKLIIFKRDAIYYINGSGPDNTGANSQYSQPIFITSTVGCSNQNSIVITPTINGSPGGLMFQSDKGIWLLGRDLSTSYIGAPVEAFNSATVNSATAIPGTNQVRFTISTDQTLMYDYYYQQWGTFVGVPGISGTIYQNLHTYLTASGAVAQETPGQYLDNGNPVLLSFTTS
ncbi:MAG: hypothetical protein ABSB69_20195, partial [Solirubrobacteraceae bacterium]